jgi:hypothetical protein
MQEDSANLLHDTAKNPTHSATFTNVKLWFFADIQLEKRNEEILKSLAFLGQPMQEQLIMHLIFCILLSLFCILYSVFCILFLCSVFCIPRVNQRWHSQLSWILDIELSNLFENIQFLKFDCVFAPFAREKPPILTRQRSCAKFENYYSTASTTLNTIFFPIRAGHLSWPP